MPGGSGTGDRGCGTALLWKAHRQGRAIVAERAGVARADHPCLWPIHRCDRVYYRPVAGFRGSDRVRLRVKFRNDPPPRRGDPGRRDLHQRTLTPLFDLRCAASYNVSPSFGWRASMSFNTFGHLFRVTTLRREPRGRRSAASVDGCPPRIPLSAADIQHDLDGRRPAKANSITQRREADQVRILSGTFIDPRAARKVTLRTPIALVIDNVDARSKDYEAIAETYRPGHADYPMTLKYGLRDPRGSGRASARETAGARRGGRRRAQDPCRAMKVRGALVQMGEIEIDRRNGIGTKWRANPSSPDAKAVKKKWKIISTASAKRAPRSAP